LQCDDAGEYLEAVEAHEQRISDGGQLGRDYGQDRDIDTVELVEATPSTALTQSGEYLSNSLQIHNNKRN